MTEVELHTSIPETFKVALAAETGIAAETGMGTYTRADPGCTTTLKDLSGRLLLSAGVDVPVTTECLLPDLDEPLVGFK